MRASTEPREQVRLPGKLSPPSFQPYALFPESSKRINILLYNQAIGGNIQEYVLLNILHWEGNMLTFQIIS